MEGDGREMEQIYEIGTMLGADPFVLLHNDIYYLYCTSEVNDPDPAISRLEQNKGIHVYTSTDLKSWTDCGLCLSQEDVRGDKWFWAPEVTYYNGRFYMVYTAEEHLGIAVSDNPTGPFVQEEKRWLSDRRAIDGSFFFDEDGQIYLYYVRLCEGEIAGNVIFAARMTPDLQSIDEEHEQMLIRAEEEWETRDCLVAEGPFVLKHKGKYYLTYSANHTRSHEYAVGYAVADDPMGPFVKYEGNPILKKNKEMVGVGHHSFTTAKDGKNLICVHHRHFSQEQFKPRMICVAEAGFVEQEDSKENVLYIGKI